MAEEFQAGAGVFVINAYVNQKSVKESTDQLGEGLDKGSERVKKSGQKMGAAFAASFATAAAAAIVVFTEIMKIDEGLDLIVTKTGATGEALDSLQNVARDVGGQVSNSFSEVGSAVGELNTRLGLTGKDLEVASKQMLDLSKVTGEDLNGVIREATRVMGDWGIASSETVVTTDKLFRATQASGIAFAELGSQLVKYGGPLRQLGFEFDEATALIALFEKEGVNADLVLGALRRSLGALGGDPAEALASVIDQIKNAGSVADANRIAIEVFGKRAGPDMAAAVREGRFEVEELYNTIKYGEATVSDSRKATIDLTETLIMFKNQLVLIIEPVMMPMFEALNDLLTAFLGLPGPIKNTLVAAAGIAAFLKYTNFITRFGKAVTWTGEALRVYMALTGRVAVAQRFATEVVESATKSQLLFAKSLNATLGPIGAVALALTAGLAVGWALNRGNLDEFSSAMERAMKDVDDFRRRIDEWALGSVKQSTILMDEAREAITAFAVEAQNPWNLNILSRSLTDLGAKLELSTETFAIINEQLTELVKTDPVAAKTFFDNMAQAAEDAGWSVEQLSQHFITFGNALRDVISEETFATTIETWADEMSALQQAAEGVGVILGEGETWIQRWNNAIGSAITPLTQFLDAQQAIVDLNKSLEDATKSLAELRGEYENVQMESILPQGDESFFEAERRATEAFNNERNRIANQIADIEKNIGNLKDRYLDVGLQAITAEENLVSQIYDLLYTQGVDPNTAVQQILDRLSTVVPAEQLAAFQEQIAAPLERAKAEALRRFELSEEEKARLASEAEVAKTTYTDLAGLLSSLPVEAREAMVAEMEASKDPLAAAARGLLDSIINPFEERLQQLYPEIPEGLSLEDQIKFANGLNQLQFNAPEEITLLEWLGRKIGEQLSSYESEPELPGMANGGPVTGGKPYIVGEVGPELFVPNRSGTIVPNRDLVSGMMGGANITNIYQTRELSAAELAQEVSYRQGRQLSGRQR